MSFKSLLGVPTLYRAFDHIVGRFSLARTSLFSRYLPYTPGIKVLDLGCGPGTSAHYFNSRDYIGIDIDQKYILAASEKLPSYRFLHTDFLALEKNYIPESGFDLILAMGVFHHLPDDLLKKYLNMARNILSSKGILLSLDGCTYQSQPYWHKKVVLNDRGQYIRDRDSLVSLIEGEGFSCNDSVEENVLLIPHSMLVISSVVDSTR